MNKVKRARYSAAIKLETAQLVVDQGYTRSGGESHERGKTDGQ